MKQKKKIPLSIAEEVAPHAGVWIETSGNCYLINSEIMVAPHAGVWIETLLRDSID